MFIGMFGAQACPEGQVCEEEKGQPGLYLVQKQARQVLSEDSSTRLEEATSGPISTHGNPKCSNGYRFIDDANTCATVSTSHGMQYGGQWASYNNAAFPKGCFETSDGRAWLNPTGTRIGEASIRLICKPAPAGLNNYGTTGCASGYVAINGDTECRAVGESNGFPWVQVWPTASLPSGCFIIDDGTFFNPTGNAGDPNTRPLCKAAPTAAPTTKAPTAAPTTQDPTAAPTTVAPTADPTESPTHAVACQPWCEGDSRAWAAKCQFNACLACDNCADTPGQLKPGGQFCDGWCKFSSLPWAKKCTFKQACGDCIGC